MPRYQRPGADGVAQGDPKSVPQVFIVSWHGGQRFEQGADVVEVRVKAKGIRRRTADGV